MNKNRVRTLLHDVWNGITQTKNQIEILHLDHEISEEVYAGLVTSLGYTVDKLTELSGSLSSKKPDSSWLPIADVFAIVCDEARQRASRVTAGHSAFGKALVRCIEPDLRSVIEELMRNATKHGAAAFTIHMSNRDGLVKIYVQDDGSGMDELTRDKMGVGECGEGKKIVEDLMAGMGGKPKWGANVRGATVVLILDSREEGGAGL